jgi:hypothetical protein
VVSIFSFFFLQAFVHSNSFLFAGDLSKILGKIQELLSTTPNGFSNEDKQCFSENYLGNIHNLTEEQIQRIVFLIGAKLNLFFFYKRLISLLHFKQFVLRMNSQQKSCFPSWTSFVWLQ